MNKEAKPIILVNKPTGSLPLSLGLIQTYAERYKGGLLKSAFQVIPVWDVENIMIHGGPNTPKYFKQYKQF